MPGKYYEELEVGRIFRHSIRRTVSEMDNVLFSALTHNPAAIHLDEEYCREHSEFKTRIMNSIYTLGLVVGVSVEDTTLGTTIGNLGMDECRFPAPVFPGDTIHVESEVVSQRESKSRPNAGLVVFEHRGYNQKNVLIASVRRTAFMMKRPADAKEST